MNARFRIVALLSIVASFAFCGFVIAFVTGLQHTPGDMTDSVGRTMRFNDRLSPEHYVIALSNFTIHDLFTLESLYSLILLGMHVSGASMILSRRQVNPQRIRRFFLAQGLIFPLGWIGIFVLPWTMASVFNGAMDPEAFIDIPFIALTAHPVWIATAMFIAFALRKRSVQATDSGSEYGSQVA